MTDTVIRTNPDGTTYEEKVVYEPLSCDFRSGLKEAKRTEIPRLAAALLGCTYDELVRREHQYKRRRNLAIGIPSALALAVAIGYLIWSRQEISKNYQRAEENYQIAQEKQKEAEENYQIAQEKQKEAEENYQTAQKNYQEAQDNLTKSLINQSYYLASESRKKLSKGDRLGAILLALEALPDKDAEPGSLQAIRPKSTIALKSLENALNVYLPKGRGGSAAISVVAKFYMTNYIVDYKATEDGHYVIIRDIDNNVGVWDTESFSRIMYLDSVDAYDVKLISDTQMILSCKTGIISYDLPSGQTLWSICDQDVTWYESEMRLSVDEKCVWLAESLRIKDLVDGTFSKRIRLLKLDASTGEITYSIMHELEIIEAYSSVTQLAYSEDGRWVAIALDNISRAV